MSKWINIDDLPTNRVEWDDIFDAPSIDIVRCKECKHRLTERIVSENDPHWIIYEVGDCKRMLGTVKDDDFCSYGERRNP